MMMKQIIFKLGLPKSEELKEEAKESIRLAWPTILSNMLGFCLSIVNLAFVGRIGQTELAAVALGAMVVNVCWSGAVGVLCAIDTLGSQAHGAGNYKRVGVVMKRGMAIVSLYSIPVLALWWFAGSLLLKLGQSEGSSKLAGMYCRILMVAAIPAYWAEAIKRALVSTGIVVPQMIVGGISIGIAAICNHLLINVLGLGFIGAPISLAIVWFLQVPLLILFECLLHCRCCCRCWKNRGRKIKHKANASTSTVKATLLLFSDGRLISKEVFEEWWPFLKLALPGIVMVCAEWSAWEICALFAGMIGEVELGAFTVNYNTMALCFMVPLTFAVVGSTRVGNNLGAGKPGLAKFVALICIILTIVVESILLLIILSVHRIWGKIFTNVPEVLSEISRTLPMVLLLEAVDGVQGVTSGILRGSGFQAFGGISNLIFYYAVSVPFSALFVFVIKRDLLFLYVGFIIGVVGQALTFVIRIICTNWKKISDSIVLREAQILQKQQQKQEEIIGNQAQNDGNHDIDEIEGKSPTPSLSETESTATTPTTAIIMTPFNEIQPHSEMIQVKTNTEDEINDPLINEQQSTSSSS